LKSSESLSPVHYSSAPVGRRSHTRGISRRTCYRISAVLVFVAGAVLLVVQVSGLPAVLTGAKNVREGTTQAEAERAMGRPPDIP
jgi:hypothetical protein